MVTLTLSGNEITDITRAAALQGDGRAAPDSSYGIWKGTTNLITNGGFETNTTGWAALSSTISRVTNEKKFGTASLRIVCSGAGATQGAALSPRVAATLGATYTLSIWVKAPPGASLRLRFIQTGGAAVGTTVFVASGEWERVSATGTMPASGTAEVGPQLYTETAQAITCYVDGAQFEAGASATPYIETNGASQERFAARVRMPVSAENWIAVRARLDPETTNIRPERVLASWEDGSAGVRLSTIGNLLKAQRIDGDDRARVTLPFDETDLMAQLQWDDAAGPRLHVNGLHGAQTLFDDFERDDGPLGTAPTGQEWVFSGAQEGEIVDGRFEWEGGVDTAGLYANVELPGTFYSMGGKVSFLGTTGYNGCTLICSNGDGGQVEAGGWRNMIHLIVTSNGWDLDVYEDALPTSIAAASFNPALDIDGTPYEVEFGILGNTMYLRLPDGTSRTITDPLIGEHAGPNLIYQITEKEEFGDVSVRWEEVWATSSGVPAYAGPTPDLATTTLDIGSDTGWTDHLNGEILWMACGGGTLTDADTEEIRAFGDSAPPIQLLPATPTFLWDADTAAYVDEVPAILPAEFEVPGSSRLLANSYAVLRVDCYLDGAATQPDDYLTPTVVVTNLEGDTIASGAATITRTGLEYMLTPTQSGNVDSLTATWSNVILSTNPAATITTHYELVGDLLFTLAEARADKAMSNATTYPDATILRTRDRIWDEFEGWLEYGIGRRLHTAYLSGTGETSVWLPAGAHTVRSIETRDGATWTAYDEDELADALLGAGGYLERLSLGYFPIGNRNIRVRYESGPIPRDIKQAALRVLKNELVGSEFDPRATQGVTDAGTFALATPGLRGSMYGIPAVDVVLQRHRANLPRFA